MWTLEVDFEMWKSKWSQPLKLQIILVWVMTRVLFCYSTYVYIVGTMHCRHKVFWHNNPRGSPHCAMCLIALITYVVAFAAGSGQHQPQQPRAAASAAFLWPWPYMGTICRGSPLRVANEGLWRHMTTRILALLHFFRQISWETFLYILAFSRTILATLSSKPSE